MTETNNTNLHRAYSVFSHLYEALLLAPTHLRERVYHDAREVHLDRVVLEALRAGLPPALGHGGVIVHVPPLAGDRHTLAVVGPHAGVVRQHLVRGLTHAAGKRVKCSLYLIEIFIRTSKV